MHLADHVVNECNTWRYVVNLNRSTVGSIRGWNDFLPVHEFESKIAKLGCS